MGRFDSNPLFLKCSVDGRPADTLRPREHLITLLRQLASTTRSRSELAYASTGDHSVVYHLF